MEITETTNPVGKVVENTYINMFVDSMKAVWDSTKITSQWWKLWKKVNFVPITTFLLKCLDDLIVYVDQMEGISGADKKATVIDAMGKLYDYIVNETLPIWLRPFTNLIKNYVINIMVSSAIDWIVAKYRNGDFRPKPADQLEAQWVILYGQMVVAKRN